MSYGAPYGYGSGYGYGVTGSRGLLAKVGNWTAQAATGAQSVSGVGFRPSLLLPLFPGAASNSALTMCMTLGAATENFQCSVSATSLNGVTTSNAHRRHSNQQCISHLFGSGVNKAAGLTSFDADGFSVDWTVAGDATLAGYLALGGGIEVSVTEHQMNATNAAESFSHGLSGPPDALLFYSIADATTPPATAAIASMTVGVWTPDFQGSSAIFANNGATTTSTRRILSNTSVIVRLETTNRRAMAVSSVDSSNVNAIYTNTSTVAQIRFFMVAIRGCRATSGLLDITPGATPTLDPFTIATPGLAPKAFFATMVPSGAGTPGGALAAVFNSIIASDGITTHSMGITDLSGVTTSNARRYRSGSTMQERNDGSGIILDAAVTFPEESVVITPATNSTNIYGEGIYLVLGNAV